MAESLIVLRIDSIGCDMLSLTLEILKVTVKNLFPSKILRSLNKYICWYNRVKIELRLKDMSPVLCRAHIFKLSNF
jgi:hypothetical protein